MSLLWGAALVLLSSLPTVTGLVRMAREPRAQKALCSLEPTEKYAMIWNDETTHELRRLWDQGLSAAEIGRRLGCSKNSIVGKVHRLGLESRPSPIRWPEAYRKHPPAVPGITGATLPPMASDEPLPLPFVPVRRAAPFTMTSLIGAPPTTIFRPLVDIKPCCWPIGSPRDRATFRFCDDMAEPGRPYCREHAKLAYVRVRDRQEDAA